MVRRCPRVRWRASRRRWRCTLPCRWPALGPRGTAEAGARRGPRPGAAFPGSSKAQAAGRLVIPLGGVAAGGRSRPRAAAAEQPGGAAGGGRLGSCSAIPLRCCQEWPALSAGRARRRGAPPGRGGALALARWLAQPAEAGLRRPGHRPLGRAAWPRGRRRLCPLLRGGRWAAGLERGYQPRRVRPAGRCEPGTRRSAVRVSPRSGKLLGLVPSGLVMSGAACVRAGP